MTDNSRVKEEFEQWWDNKYIPPFHCPLDFYEMEKAFIAGYLLGQSDAINEKDRDYEI